MKSVTVVTAVTVKMGVRMWKCVKGLYLHIRTMFDLSSKFTVTTVTGAFHGFLLL